LYFLPFFLESFFGLWVFSVWVNILTPNPPPTAVSCRLPLEFRRQSVPLLHKHLPSSKQSRFPVEAFFVNDLNTPLLPQPNFFFPSLSILSLDGSLRSFPICLRSATPKDGLSPPPISPPHLTQNTPPSVELPSSIFPTPLLCCSRSLFSFHGNGFLFFLLAT